MIHENSLLSRECKSSMMRNGDTTREIEENTKRHKDLPQSVPRRIDMVEMTTLPKEFHRFNEFQMNIPGIIFTDVDKYLKVYFKVQKN